MYSACIDTCCGRSINNGLYVCGLPVAWRYLCIESGAFWDCYIDSLEMQRGAKLLGKPTIRPREEKIHSEIKVMVI